MKASSSTLGKLAAAVALACGAAFLALSRGEEPPLKAEAARTSAPTSQPGPVQLVNITQKAGITFQYNNGAFGLKLFPENMGGGVAFIDYDGDGYQDIFLPNGRDWSAAEVKAYKNGTGKAHVREHSFTLPPQPPRRRTTGALYHNKGDGTFEDVTARAGLDIEMYGMGASVGDYDNDGRDDLYVTGYGRNYLFRNQSAKSKPRFQDVTQAAGVRSAAISTSAAWLDYDRDGRLDLFVGHYSNWTPASDHWHSLDEKNKSYSSPDFYQGDFNTLYRNRGDGSFEDVSLRAGIRVALAANGKPMGAVPRKLQTKTLGVALGDYNGDGWIDVLVANDNEPNYLFRNSRNGTFSEVGIGVGIAYNRYGRARSGMGIDAADVDHSGRDTILIGNYSGQMLGFYRDLGNGTFKDAATESGIGNPSHPFLTFGCIFLDINNDGWPDVFTANGHVLDDVSKIQHDVTYAERPQLFLNLQKRRFIEIGLRSGAAMSKGVVGRGVAYADIDLDGDVDVLLSTNGGSPLLLRNEGGNKNRSIRLILQGSAAKGGGGKRSAIGARVRARVGRETLHRMVRSGSSYLSQSELPLTLGLGQEAQATQITVTWPDGSTTTVPQARANTILTIQQGKGVISQKPFRTPRVGTRQSQS